VEVNQKNLRYRRPRTKLPPPEKCGGQAAL